MSSANPGTIELLRKEELLLTYEIAGCIVLGVSLAIPCYTLQVAERLRLLAHSQPPELQSPFDTTSHISLLLSNAINVHYANESSVPLSIPLWQSHKNLYHQTMEPYTA